MIKKKYFLLICLVLAVGIGLLLSGRISMIQYRTFDCDGMQIDLPSRFREENLQDVTAAWVNGQAAVLVVHDLRTELPLEEFAADYLARLQEESGVTLSRYGMQETAWGRYISYTQEANTHYTYLYHTDFGNWIVRFVCPESQRDRLLPEILRWEQSIRFSY